MGHVIRFRVSVSCFLPAFDHKYKISEKIIITCFVHLHISVIGLFFPCERQRERTADLWLFSVVTRM